MRSAPNSSVRNLTIRRIGDGGIAGDASAGILVKESAESTITGNSVMNDVSAYQSDGVDVLSSPGVLVAHNRLARNAWNGMFILDSPRSRVMGNRLDHNLNQGMEVNFGSDSVQVASNVASNNIADGIVVGALKRVPCLLFRVLVIVAHWNFVNVPEASRSYATALTSSCI